MQGYEQSTYGDCIADIYDQMHSAWEPTPTVRTIAELAAGGPVLELGVGTGRVALPLARTGLRVVGVDISAAMLTKLREKDPESTVETIQGDFLDLPVAEKFSVIFVVNSLLQLSDPADQLTCLRQIRDHLEPDGVLAMEEANPAVFTHDGLNLFHMSHDQLHLLASAYDPMTQHYRAQHVILTDGSVRLNPISLRLTTTHEFDLMAQLAGLRLQERWGNWERTTPYLPTSRAHISLYTPT
ncbi:class I SAM-dependent methyltransferase [Actinophytocola sp.]|uniref:class I SAM-dependent methyltransferase n=1 Tax=Actinophytocola sp. TaxID=1872138 RepID=UPI002D800DB2|nr:class I SAM-dependent methyltransferase [Actinophytocola sp.]HET9143882.1 class I SAM-dependent methyltransferase [Actinophytocola sp.]